MNELLRLRLGLVVVAAWAVARLAAGEDTNQPGGAARPRQNPRLFVHDPSTIVKCGEEYWVFSTGPGITSRHSRDLKEWGLGPRVFESPPAWTTNVVKGFRGYFWAPDVIRQEGRYLLYYSVSSWGVNTSAIGLVTNATLDPTDPRFHWADQGPVCQSKSSDDFNAIDPCAARTDDALLWLGFGSFWSGIKLVQLDPTTGKRLAPDSPMYSLASHSSIEAACIAQHGKYYYLFVNWGLCCRGTNSTYNIRVGRSASITGPYLDKQGADLRTGGGSVFLETEGAFIGPGHAGVYTEGQTHWLSCHYYDANRAGSAALEVRPLQWDAEGWPTAKLDPGK